MVVVVVVCLDMEGKCIEADGMRKACVSGAEDCALAS